MANLVSTTVTGTLNTTSTITGPGAGVSAINASNVSTGTLASDRLPTVPTSKGGTGLTSVGSSGQFLAVSAPGALAWCTLSAGGGGYKMTTYTGSSTWTCPSSVKDLKVTVVGAGGGSGSTNPGTPVNCASGGGGAGGMAVEWIPAASLTGPVSVTIGTAPNPNAEDQNGCPGGTSSFGAFLSASGGQGGCGCNHPSACPQSLGGVGSGGTYNVCGGHAVTSGLVAASGSQSLPNKGGGGSPLAGGSAGAAYLGCPDSTQSGDTWFGPNMGTGAGIGSGAGPFVRRLRPGSNGRVIVEEFF